MKFTWTMKELAPLNSGKTSLKTHRINCLKMARACVIERKSELNAYAPTSKALAEVKQQLDRELEKLGSIGDSNSLIE
jgi:hypothetical protein